MADNVTIAKDGGSPPGGTVISTDDVGGGVQVQRVKVTHGADGTANDANDATPLPVKTGTVSTSNASTTALDAGLAYTGTWEDVSIYDSLVVAVETDQNGRVDLQFSTDGTNVGSTLTRYYDTARINPPHRFTVTRQYARVVFTNTSASNQSYLRLQVMFGDKQQLNIPVDATVSQNYDAIVVRPTEWRAEVALGLRQGDESWTKFGYNEDVDTGTEILASFGGTYVAPTTARTLSIVSANAADDGDPAGTGAQTLSILGIDANRNQQTESVTLNGTAAVTTSGSWLGVNRVTVTAAGSSLGNVGAITGTATTDATTQFVIPAGESVTQQCIFFVPANYQALVDHFIFSAARIAAGTNPQVTFKVWVFNATTNVKREILRKTVDTDVQNTLAINPEQPLLVEGSTAIMLEVTTNQDNTDVTGRFSLILVRDLDA